MAALWRAATRRKPLHPGGCDADAGTRLARVLTTTDLTALGVGSTLGVGVYVLAGGVARSAAGPAVVLSFLLAAVASVFAGLCYAEFGSRVPRAGSAYVYSYVSIGEFVAFVIGWNLILEYVIGSASVVRGLSMYLDSMMNDTMKHAFQSFAPINVSILSPYFDFFAFATSLLLAVVLAVGVKESSYVNTIFTLLNIAVILFVIIAGSIKADPANWRIRREDIPADVVGGEGGFLPFGVAGVLRGAATCFYGFVGFDCIATTGEEVKKPQRAIPLAIIMSLMIVFLSYFGVSTILTMMVPYYQQDEDAPIPHVFTSVGWPLATWIVSVGGVFGLCASLFGSMFPLPRIIYAMASDGLLFRFLGAVSARLRTPVVATLLAGLLTGLMAGLFELSHLVNMMSIGTLLAYTIVAACVLLLRFTDNDDDEARDGLLITDTDTDNPAAAEGKGHSCAAIAEQLFNIPCARSPTPLTYNIVSVQVFLFCVMSAVTSQSIIQMSDLLAAGSAGAVAAVAVEVVVMLLMVISIALQPRSARASPFRVPFVPFLPALSIFINVYLMMMLDVLTWIRFAVWMAAGLCIYFCYSVRHSTADLSSSSA
ncbi:cationic amino acid transporter 2-like isoform X5 [Bacillus rossius redtenbacheri]|uniref:cationic amino acid transporter 2-like isoform X5 n=1 Tax=Bacillus rossius redtenbacheri TaxID=93214 RepID=UPI002FDE9CE1